MVFTLLNRFWYFVNVCKLSTKTFSNLSLTSAMLTNCIVCSAIPSLTQYLKIIHIFNEASKRHCQFPWKTLLGIFSMCHFQNVIQRLDFLFYPHSFLRKKLQHSVKLIRLHYLPKWQNPNIQEFSSLYIIIKEICFIYCILKQFLMQNCFFH